MIRILFVDDEPSIVQAMQHAVGPEMAKIANPVRFASGGAG
jgi:hypothetical protein